jgi:starch synthase
MSELKVLLVSPEVAPFSKTGGLADVAGSLPKALAKKGVDVRVVMPKFKNLPQKYQKLLKSLGSGYVDICYRTNGFEIHTYSEDGVTYYFIEHNIYFDRDGYYGYGDDGERFTFFCKAALEMLPIANFKPDIIHSNDWQSGVVSLLLKAKYAYSDFYKDIKTVFTIHNMKYQGVFPKEIMNSLLGISWEHFTYDKIEFYDQVNYLKAAINYSDAVTTVSKTYADEIKHDFFAENLGGTIRTKSDNLYGIVNGIDYDVFNPATDHKIFANFDINDLKGKYTNKRMLQEFLGLPVSPNTPIIGLVTRLVENKGLDLIGAVITDLLQHDIQIVVLGSGEYRYEEMLKYYAHAYPTKVSVNIKYDDYLSHRIYAASDMFLMPSQFEPCGLSQIISMRYGTVPIVRETGGLKDTVIPYNKFTGEGTGFSFSNYNAHEMLSVIENAISKYHEREEWRNIIMNGMKIDFSWSNSANEYIDLYHKLLTNKELHKKNKDISSNSSNSTRKNTKKKSDSNNSSSNESGDTNSNFIDSILTNLENNHKNKITVV